MEGPRLRVKDLETHVLNHGGRGAMSPLDQI